MEFEKYLYQNKNKGWKRLYNPLHLNAKQKAFLNWETIADFESRIEEITWFCGVEVHKHHIIWAFYGKRHQEQIAGPVLRCYNTLDEFDDFIKAVRLFSPKRFLMETTGIFHFSVAWNLENSFLESEIVVMNARMINRTITSVRKNDRSDAQKLALLSQYNELLRYSYVPSPEHANVRELTRMRINYVKETTKIKNRVKKIFSMFGFNWIFSFDNKGAINFLLAYLQSNWTFGRFLELCRKTGVHSNLKRYFNELDFYKKLNLPRGIRNTLLFCFNSLLIHQQEVKILEKQIYTEFEAIESLNMSLKYIEAMPGMQTFSKISLLVELGDIRRFPTAGDVAVYSGIAPRGGTSGIEDKHETKEKIVQKDKPNSNCNRILKLLVIRAAGVIFRTCEAKKNVDDIARYASRFTNLKKEYFKKAFKVAAKWIRKMFYCLTHAVSYDPLAGLNIPESGKKQTRTFRITRVKRAMYERNRALKYEINTIYDVMEKMGIEQEIINGIRTKCKLSTAMEGKIIG